MSRPDTRSGTIVGICFVTLWCGTAFGMGYMAWSWGAPIFFPIVAWGMGCFGIVLAITICRQQGQTESLQRRKYEDHVTYTGDYTSPYAQPVEKKSYTAPSYCPSCGTAISTDEVDWVAPLKAVCPYCEAVMDAVER